MFTAFQHIPTVSHHRGTMGEPKKRSIKTSSDPIAQALMYSELRLTLHMPADL
ncbi:hypothetical protein RMS29_023140 [Agrobacterium rosae]|uniref:hypothetical protein n=1 Tax=Agrobacterium rosae TaxID=1972867 RepID=UPI003D7994A5